MKESLHLGGRVIKRSLAALVPPTGPDTPVCKRLLLPQGELAQFYDGEEGIRYAAVLELRPGTIRGNHYHRQKQEWLYVISGELRLAVGDVESGDVEFVQMVAGDLAFVPAGIAHALQPTASGWAIELSAVRFDPADTFRHKLVE